MLFTTQNEGWMGSSSPEDGLHVTHDGGKTWQEITLPHPAKAGPACLGCYLTEHEVEIVALIQTGEIQPSAC